METTDINKQLEYPGKYFAAGSNIFLRLISKPVTITWEWVMLAVFAVLALVSRFAELGARVMSHDESLHVFYSWQLAAGKGFSHTPMMHGPFLFEFTAFFNLFFGANDFTSRLAPAVLGILIVTIVPQLLRPWIGRTGALAGSALFLVSPYMLYYSRYIRHDTLVIAWMLLAVFAILAYLKNRKEWHLVILVCALALMFATMEITFIYLAIFVSFLVGRMMILYQFRWREMWASAEFDLIVLIGTLGSFFSSTIALVILNPIVSSFTGAPFVDLNVLSSFDAGWAVSFAGLRLWALLAVFVVAATAIGFVWGKKRWLKLAGLFLAITIPLFTTFFTNPSGIASGFIGSLGYWMSQQGVARGTQPWYYFLVVFPIYEYLPLFGGVGAAIFFTIHRKNLSSLSRLFVPLTLWWGLGIFIALSLAGEKMPWLSTHVTVPFILLTSWWIGQILAGEWKHYSNYRKAHDWLSGISLGVFIILLLLTIRTSYFANYVNFDYTTEYIDYAHGAPGVKWLLDDIQAIANHTGVGRDLKIAYDDEVTWPMAWYLRDYPNQSYYAAEPNRQSLDAPVVVAGAKNWKKVELLLGSNYHRFEVIRMWWPMEDYKNLTWERIQNAITDPAMRSAVWDILWNRDYTNYAKLTNETLNPPTDWSPAEKMRVYVRNDIALKMLSLSLGSTMLADIPKPVDAYISVKRMVDSKIVIQNSGLNNPRNLVIAKDGSVYAADTGNSRILKYNTAGELITSWGTRSVAGQTPPAPATFAEPWGITLDGDGNVLVADTWNHRIQKFDPNGKFLLQWGISGVAADGLDRLWGPRGIAVAPDGAIYVTDSGNKRVVAFSPEGKPLFEFLQEADARLDEPVGIAIGPDNKVYVADTWNFRVAVFALDGKFERSFPVQGWNSNSIDNKPYLAVDSAGRVYVTDPEGYRVLVFSPDGKPLLTFGEFGSEESSFGLPTGITLSPDGKLWVADAGNARLAQFQNLWP
jgi:uncharacterized protein (TIGR03663 family)